MSLTDLLRKRLATPTHEKLPVPDTMADRAINNLIHEASIGNVDAIRLIFERVDGQPFDENIEVRHRRIATLKPCPATNGVKHYFPGMAHDDAASATIDEGGPMSEKECREMIAKGKLRVEFSPPPEGEYGPVLISEAQALEILAACVEPN